MYFPKPAINENDLAIIERGDTASHSIEAGQYVSWKGKLGKANAAILQGATLDDSLFSYETEGVINSLNNKFLKFVKKTASISVGANSKAYASVSISDIDGYKKLGVLMLSSSFGDNVQTTATLTNDTSNTVYVISKSYWAQALTINVAFYVVYIKTDVLSNS